MPFGINEGIEVYLDDSLKQFTTVYPAAGNDHSAVKLTIPELERAAGAKRMGGCYIEIHPNAFATELISMIVAKIGQRYWIINWKITFLRNG